MSKLELDKNHHLQEEINDICNDQISSNQNFAEIEEKIIRYWKENKLFEKSVEFRKENNFVFYDGPPFANGLPHYGHLLTGFIKDTIARYQTSKGKRVERRFGWDCHGLPAEMHSEKELGIQGRVAINKFGIDKFNDHCKSSVLKYTKEWEKYVNRQGRWVDFENSYKTMDLSYMESILWIFKELYKKGYIYESLRVMPYSWACETPLSNFETRMDNSYRERADKSIVVGFILKNKPKSITQDFDQYKILSWTTTPWTLPSNLALAVNSEITYVAVKKDNVCYITSKSSFLKYAKDLGLKIDENVIQDNLSSQDFFVAEFNGSEILDLKYKPIFNYFDGHKNAFRILHANFVTDADGTGIVHIAPGFGEDDQTLCEQNEIKIVCPVDNSGKFTDEVYDFKGIQVFEAIDNIIIKLKKQGNWVKTDQYLHNYPHCWRTDTPLIYKAVSSWYVKVTAFKDRMVELNKQINWIPGYVKENIFGKWLENARDWSISRNRFFGTPIPIWRSNDLRYPRMDVYGSIEELERDFGVKVTDLHRPFIDSLTRPNPDDPTGKSMMVRCEDVFDCWFESGSMPIAQAHYPFENKEWFESNFPGDFITEYTAQTRGWFYTLMVLSTAIFDKPPFLNCICHGLILDATGQKLSKRLNNYPDPIDIFNKYGSDALRFTMLSSPVVSGADFLIDKDGMIVYDTLRLVVKPMWNAYHFLTLYLEADNIMPDYSLDSKNVMDVYIISKLCIATKNIDMHLTNFNIQFACEEVVKFFDVLNNWYIRRNRARFWKSESDNDKKEAYNTLYSCILTIAKASASLLPMTTERIYLGFISKFMASSRSNDHKISIHLEDFPDMSEYPIDLELIAKMDNVIDICSSALFIRSKNNIRTRQPLSKLIIASKKELELEDFAEIIKDEINVKDLSFTDEIDIYATNKLSLNFKEIAKRIPQYVKQIIGLSKSNQWQVNDDLSLSLGGNIILKDEYSLDIIPNDPNNTKELSDKKSLVVLDLNITDELRQEGIARDIVRTIQQTRKDRDFRVTDRVLVAISGNKECIEICEKFKEYISEQCLCNISIFEYSDYDEVNHFKVDTSIIEGQIEIYISKKAL